MAQPLSSNNLMMTLYSAFEKVAANLGIDVVAAKAEFCSPQKLESRFVVTEHLSTKGPGADMDLDIK